MNNKIISFDKLCQGAENKRVMYRGDFNVPYKDQVVADDTRIRKSLPALLMLLNSKAKLIVTSHLGRPNKKYSTEFSLLPVAKRLSKLLNCEVVFSSFKEKDTWQAKSKALKAGQVLLLDNLRFNPGEEEASSEFVNYLSSLCDFYVSDAFASCHRNHASIVGITSHVPTAPGPLILSEVAVLRSVIENPIKPVMAVIGGSKISSKIKLLSSLGQRMEYILIGGGMANTLLLALGKEVGNSLVEKDCLDLASEFLKNSKAEVCLPIDVVVAEKLDNSASIQTVDVDSIPNNMSAFDIGPQTCAEWNKKLQAAKTVFWNGPLGVIENANFASGSIEFANSVSKRTISKDLNSIAGGGDTIALLKQANVIDKFSYVSTGGGAFLEYMEGRILPGLKTLNL